MAELSKMQWGAVRFVAGEALTLLESDLHLEMHFDSLQLEYPAVFPPSNLAIHCGIIYHVVIILPGGNPEKSPKLNHLFPKILFKSVQTFELFQREIQKFIDFWQFFCLCYL